MVHIVFLILKSIGIVLLILLGLLLSLFLLILLVPFRYKIEASFYKAPRGSVRVTWLFHLLSVQVQYEEELKASVKLFGKSLIRRRASEEEVEEEVQEVTEEAKNGAADTIKEVREEVKDAATDTTKQPNEAEKRDVTTDSTTQSIEVEKRDTTTEPQKQLSEIEETPKEMPKETVQEAAKETSKEMEIETEAAERNEDSTKSKKGSFRRRIAVWKKRMAARIRHIQRAWQQMIETGREKRAWVQSIRTQVEDPVNRDMVRLIWRQGKRMVRHVMPRKGSGTLTFGLEDPYLMGQILTVAALFYPVYREQIQITPVFDTRILEGDITLTGHVRCATMIVLGGRLLFNKRLRETIRRFMRYQEGME